MNDEVESITEMRGKRASLGKQRPSSQLEQTRCEWEKGDTIQVTPDEFMEQGPTGGSPNSLGIQKLSSRGPQRVNH